MAVSDLAPADWLSQDKHVVFHIVSVVPAEGPTKMRNFDQI